LGKERLKRGERRISPRRGPLSWKRDSVLKREQPQKTPWGKSAPEETIKKGRK